MAEQGKTCARTHRDVQTSSGHVPWWLAATPPCKYWMLGSCRDGLQCQYRHPFEDISELTEYKYWSQIEAILGPAQRSTVDSTWEISNWEVRQRHLLYRHQVDFLLSEFPKITVHYNSELERIQWKLKSLVEKQERAHYKDQVAKRVKADQIFAAANEKFTDQPDWIDLHGLPVEAAIEKLHEFVKDAQARAASMVAVCCGFHTGADHLCHTRTAVTIFAHAHHIPTHGNPGNRGVVIFRLKSQSQAEQTSDLQRLIAAGQGLAAPDATQEQSASATHDHDPSVQMLAVNGSSETQDFIQDVEFSELLQEPDKGLGTSQSA